MGEKLPKFKVHHLFDRSCTISTIIQDYPILINILTDSDCENGANTSVVKAKESYYICDYHLGQLIGYGLAKE